MSKLGRQFLLSIDIGTTKIRACLFDLDLNLVWSEDDDVQVITVVKGEAVHVEIDPDKLWDQFCGLIKAAANHCPGGAKAIISTGICTQRNTFITWDVKTLKPCHRFIVWKDGRAIDAVKSWNSSMRVKALNAAGYVAHFVTRSPRFKAARIFSFINAMVTLRLMVTLDGNEEMKQLRSKGKLAYGCIETWLLAKLSKGRLIVTEPSCASATGLYDPFNATWGYTILRLIGFPTDLLPKLVDTVNPGVILLDVDPDVLGFPLKIGSVVGDQTAAVFGAGCRARGDAKISLGTGTFVNVLTGSSPHASMKGLYPLVAWSTPKQITYVAEGKSDDTATLIAWALSIGLCSNVEETSAIALETEASPGLQFIPAFGGIQTPINDDHACAAFLGLRAETTKPQMLRAILDAIAFRVYQIWETLEEEMGRNIGDSVRICGGVGQNDFICQTIATLLIRPVERVLNERFVSASGAAMLAGISADLWTIESSTELTQIESTFRPDLGERPHLLHQYNLWKKAVLRCLNFYEPS
uniref:Glycerol kinase 5 n=1 Tax=Panagrellus redivivus TaxID=6233 RepID=A0A7E4VUW2_PANRE